MVGVGGTHAVFIQPAALQERCYVGPRSSDGLETNAAGLRRRRARHAVGDREQRRREDISTGSSHRGRRVQRVARAVTPNQARCCPGCCPGSAPVRSEHAAELDEATHRSVP